MKQRISNVSTRVLWVITMVVACAFNLHAQPYSKEIAAFKTQDSMSMPPKHAILFIGSSSFTKWKDVQDYFPGKKIINRAFGGSTLVDVIHYADDVITPYAPKQVVIYCGENDLASGGKINADTVLMRFQHLFNFIRKNLPRTAVAYVAIKPSPSRRNFWPEAIKANALIRDFLKTKSHTSFVDVYYPMLAKGPQVHGSYFTSDSLHMNADGYKLWQQLMAPGLVKTK